MCLQEAESGIKQSFIDVFIRGHRGPDPNNTDVLCSQAAKDKLVSNITCYTKFGFVNITWCAHCWFVGSVWARNGEASRRGCQVDGAAYRCRRFVSQR